MKLGAFDVAVIVVVAALVGFGVIEPRWAQGIPAYLFGVFVSRRLRRS